VPLRVRARGVNGGHEASGAGADHRDIGFLHP